MAKLSSVEGNKFFVHFASVVETKNAELWISNNGGTVSMYLKGSETAVITDNPVFLKYHGKSHSPRFVSWLLQKLPAPLKEAVKFKVPIIPKAEFVAFVNNKKESSSEPLPLNLPLPTSNSTLVSLKRPYLLLQSADRSTAPIIKDRWANSPNNTLGLRIPKERSQAYQEDNLSRFARICKNSTNSVEQFSRKRPWQERLREMSRSVTKKLPRMQRCMLCRQSFMNEAVHLESYIHDRAAKDNVIWTKMNRIQKDVPSFDQFLSTLSVAKDDTTTSVQTVETTEQPKTITATALHCNDSFEPVDTQLSLTSVMNVYNCMLATSQSTDTDWFNFNNAVNRVFENRFMQTSI